MSEHFGVPLQDIISPKLIFIYHQGLVQQAHLKSQYQKFQSSSTHEVQKGREIFDDIFTKSIGGTTNTLPTNHDGLFMLLYRRKRLFITKRG
jgi:hypothetical protein